MPDPRLQRSPPLIRLSKWIGLYLGCGALLYLHFSRYPPEELRMENKSMVHDDDRQDIIGFREELIESAKLYRKDNGE